MTKLLVFINVVLAFVFLGINTSMAASHYTTFQTMDFVEGGCLLKDMDPSVYYDKISKRTFSGWKIHIINNGVKVKYITDTLLDFYNDGKTPLSYTYEKSNKDVIKFGISVSDQMDTEMSGTIEKFKAGLSNKLKISGDYERKVDVEEKMSLKIDVDPQTQLIIYQTGEGYITNGVAASYLFWIRVSRGGFEFFVPSTQYQKIVKRKI